MNTLADERAEWLQDHFRSPYHRGRLERADGAHRAVNRLCGDEVRLEIVRDGGGRLREAWFTGRGCTLSQAAASILCEFAEGRLLDELRAFDAQAMLGPFLDEYIAKRTDVKPATLSVWRHTRRNLIDFFGPRKLLRDITPGDADDWKRWLASDQELGANTIAKRCRFAKMFFRAAVKHRLIESNPMAELRGKGAGQPVPRVFRHGGGGRGGSEGVPGRPGTPSGGYCSHCPATAGCAAPASTCG